MAALEGRAMTMEAQKLLSELVIGYDQGGREVSDVFIERVREHLARVDAATTAARRAG
jgi:hypothetical protein